MEKIVIPFVHGRGKTGSAKNGELRVLIKDTSSYPRAFEHFRGIVSRIEQKHKEMFPDTPTPPVAKHLLDYFNTLTAHVHEVDIAGIGEKVILLNLDMFKGSDYNYLKSIKVDGQTVYLY